jgi:hypothetical protein
MIALKASYANCNPPNQSGFYLTDLGILYYNADEKRFQVDETTTVDFSFAISKYYTEVEVFNNEDMARQYKQGFMDGQLARKLAHSIE